MAGSEGLQDARGDLWGLHPYAYLTGVGKRDKALCSFGRSIKARFLGADHSYLGGLSTFWGFGDPTEAKLVKCMMEGRPFLHMDHAYFKRGYEHGNVRVNYGHFHQVGLLDVPDDRSGLARKRLEPWKSGGRHVVLVVPSERICAVLAILRGHSMDSKNWVRWAESEIKQYTDRPVVVKHKGGSILDVLRDAHALVSLSSVAEVEAAIRGIPVFVTRDSPAWQVGDTNWANIERPSYPDRDKWVRTLSYSQFHVSELADGTAKRIIEELYGDQHLQRAKDSGR